MKAYSLIITLLLGIMGLYLLWTGGQSISMPIQVWSDMKAFTAKVISDTNAAHVLQYGGEKEGTDFDDILQRVWDLSRPGWRVIHVGVVACFVSLVGLALWLIMLSKMKHK